MTTTNDTVGGTTLSNLIGMTLEKITSDPAAIQRLIAATERNIEDSKVKAVSADGVLVGESQINNYRQVIRSNIWT